MLLRVMLCIIIVFSFTQEAAAASLDELITGHWKTIFTKCGTSYFSSYERGTIRSGSGLNRSDWDIRQIKIEIKGHPVTQQLAVSEIDRLNGIRGRAKSTFRVKAIREFVNGKWETWGSFYGRLWAEFALTKGWGKTDTGTLFFGPMEGHIVPIPCP